MHENLTKYTIIQESSNKSFGIVFFVFFAIVALYFLYISKFLLSIIFLSISLFFLVIAFLYPSILTPLKKLWLRFGLILHLITNPIIMALIFYVVFLPIGLILKILKKDPLNRKFDPEVNSYWINRDKDQDNKTSLKNQF